MKNLETTFGTVNIFDVDMIRANGYGQYSMLIDFSFNGENHKIKLQSTDSELFDLVHGESNKMELLLENSQITIENSIEDFVNSL